MSHGARSGVYMNELAEPTVTAVSANPAGSTVAAGGLGVCGNPHELISAQLATALDDLHNVANNCGLDDLGPGLLLQAERIRKATCSYVGSNPTFARKILAGEN
jgi:3-oxoacid CoA-transferase subunit A